MGTGYHHANLTGYIDGTVTLPKSQGYHPESDGGTNSTETQQIGYGVMDYGEGGEAEHLDAIYFYIALGPIDNPVPVSP